MFGLKNVLFVIGAYVNQQHSDIPSSMDGPNVTMVSAESDSNVCEPPLTATPPPSMTPMSSAQSSSTSLEALNNATMTEEERQGCEAILAALTEEEAGYIADEEMALRHLRAEKGDVTKAIEKMKATLAWRRDFNVDVIKNCFKNEEVDKDTQAKHEAMRKILQEEGATGKIYTRGCDKEGRAILYMRPSCENTNHPEQNMQFLVYNMERAIACTRHASSNLHSKFIIVIDYINFKLSNAPPLKVSRATLDILQNHYPERLHKAYLVDPPRVFSVFWRVVRPFIDPVTKSKIEFCSGGNGRNLFLKEVVGDEKKVELDTLEACVGGTAKGRGAFGIGRYLNMPFCQGYSEEE